MQHREPSPRDVFTAKAIQPHLDQEARSPFDDAMTI